MFIAHLKRNRRVNNDDDCSGGGQGSDGLEVLIDSPPLEIGRVLVSLYVRPIVNAITASCERQRNFA